MDTKNDVQFFFERRDIPAARDELRLALKNERKQRAAEREKQAKITQAHKLEALLHQSAWDELKRILEEQEEKFWTRHVADVKAGKAIDQRELDRALGKLDGIRAILSAPEKAATILLRERKEEPTA